MRKIMLPFFGCLYSEEGKYSVEERYSVEEKYSVFGNETGYRLLAVY